MSDNNGSVVLPDDLHTVPQLDPDPIPILLTYSEGSRCVLRSVFRRAFVHTLPPLYQPLALSQHL